MEYKIVCVDGYTRFECEAESFRDAVALAIKERANLSRVVFKAAYLPGLDFSECDLFGANFAEARLDGARFTRAYANEACFANAKIVDCDFVSAKLHSARFDNADASYANFARADMRRVSACDTDFSYCNMAGAELIGGDLRSSVLFGTNLAEANVRECAFDETYGFAANYSRAQLDDKFPEFVTNAKANLFYWLDRFPHTADVLQDAVKSGLIDGDEVSKYRAGACILATIAHAAGELYSDLRGPNPIEAIGAHIKLGHTPRNSVYAALLDSWIDEFRRGSTT